MSENDPIFEHTGDSWENTTDGGKKSFIIGVLWGLIDGIFDDDLAGGVAHEPKEPGDSGQPHKPGETIVRGPDYSPTEFTF